MYKQGRRCYTYALTLLCAIASTVAAQPPIVTQENISGAILGTSVFTDSELAAMDLNVDSKVDVADLLAFLNGGAEGQLEGYKWLVQVTFTDDFGIIIPFNYAFVLSIEADSAIVSVIDAFDPTVGLLQQKLSVVGQIPGQLREKYSPSQILPIGTVFSKSDDGDFTHLSATIELPSNHPANPTGKTLFRGLNIHVDRPAVFGNDTNHGTVEDGYLGFLPGAGVSGITGQVTLFRHLPATLTALE